MDYPRSDTEGEAAHKLTGCDKAVLGSLWLVSAVYGLLSDQVHYQLKKIPLCMGSGN